MKKSVYIAIVSTVPGFVKAKLFLLLREVKVFDMTVSHFGRFASTF